MPASDFAAWLAAMKIQRGWSAQEAARQLGCGRNMVTIWAREAAPLYIGLACAALAANLPVWSAP